MGRVMVEMGCRQHDPGRPDRRILGRGRRGDLAAPTAAPGLLFLVPPAAVAHMAHDLAMRPAADLAAALGVHEPDPVADLLSVDRVVPAQLRLDRHGLLPAQASREWRPAGLHGRQSALP
jgi:hypothetical protein